MTGYVRQSASSIIDGEDIVASPLNAEFNALRDAFSGTTGHGHTGAVGDSPKINLATSVVGVLPPANGGMASKNNFEATVDPTVNDDETEGYSNGSLWVNDTDDKVWICGSPDTGSAYWINIGTITASVNAINALTPAADKYIYYTSGTTAALGDISSFSRTLLAQTNSGDVMTTMGITPYIQSLVDDPDAATARASLGITQTNLGISVFAQTLLDDTSATDFLTTLGFSSFMQGMRDDTDASTALTSLGVSTYMKTLLDDTTASAARTTLAISLANLGISSYMETLLDDTDASTALGTLGVTPFMKTLLDDTTASDALTTLGFSTFFKTLVDDADASTVLTDLGVSTFAKTILDDTSASNMLTTLGVSSFAKTILDDTDATAVKSTLELGSYYGTASDNVIINGQFDVGQDGLSTRTTAGFIRDLWYVSGLGSGGSTGNVTVQNFPLGQTAVPGEPSNYLRYIFTGGAGAGDYINAYQNIEDVRTLAGQLATLTLWARAGSGTPSIGIEFIQDFGTGGSPSSQNQMPLGALQLSTTWTRYDILFTPDSISGKTIGSNVNSKALLAIWYSAGSNYATRASNIGTQSATVDLANISIRKGDHRGNPFPFGWSDYKDKLDRVKRHYQTLGTCITSAVATAASQTAYASVAYPVGMRIIPTVTFLNASASNSNGMQLHTGLTTNTTIVYYTQASAAGGFWAYASPALDARTY